MREEYEESRLWLPSYGFQSSQPRLNPSRLLDELQSRDLRKRAIHEKASERVLESANPRHGVCRRQGA